MLPACIATPGPSEKGLLASTERLLSIDFGRRATSVRMEQIQRLPKATFDELQRAKHILGMGSKDPIPQAMHQATRRTTNFGRRGASMIGSELRRRPHEIPGLLPTPKEFERNTANNLETTLQLFGVGRRPLSEIDDMEHRTDYRDTRPEKTWWQRIRRRLPI